MTAVHCWNLLALLQTSVGKNLGGRARGSSWGSVLHSLPNAVTLGTSLTAEIQFLKSENQESCWPMRTLTFLSPFPLPVTTTLQRVVLSRGLASCNCYYRSQFGEKHLSWRERERQSCSEYIKIPYKEEKIRKKEIIEIFQEICTGALKGGHINKQWTYGKVLNMINNQKMQIKAMRQYYLLSNQNIKIPNT